MLVVPKAKAGAETAQGDRPKGKSLGLAGSTQGKGGRVRDDMNRPIPHTYAYTTPHIHAHTAHTHTPHTCIYTSTHNVLPHVYTGTQVHVYTQIHVYTHTINTHTYTHHMHVHTYCTQIYAHTTHTIYIHTPHTYTHTIHTTHLYAQRNHSHSHTLTQVYTHTHTQVLSLHAAPGPGRLSSGLIVSLGLQGQELNLLNCEALALW